MIKHIVIFRLKEELPAAEKQEVMNCFKRGIEALPAVIPCIKDIHVGFNINSEEQCDICLESSFATLEDVHTYAAHPAHRAVAGALIPHVAFRSCVDFNTEE